MITNLLLIYLAAMGWAVAFVMWRAARIQEATVDAAVQQVKDCNESWQAVCAGIVAAKLHAFHVGQDAVTVELNYTREQVH